MVISVSRGRSTVDIKAIFAAKVRLYLEIRLPERLLVSMFPLRDTEETELKSKVLKLSKNMVNYPVTRRCQICVICHGLRIGRPCVKVHFERTEIIMKWQRTIIGNHEPRGALTCFQLPVGVCSQMKMMGKCQSRCLPPRCWKDV